MRLLPGVLQAHPSNLPVKWKMSRMRSRVSSNPFQLTLRLNSSYGTKSGRVVSSPICFCRYVLSPEHRQLLSSRRLNRQR